MTVSQGEGDLSTYRLRLVGYGLLLFAVVDVVQLLYPPQLTNAVWELQTMGAIVERLPVPLLGLVMIFFGEEYDRRMWEDLFLKFVSWFCLLLALLFFLLVPLGVVNTMRINTQNSARIEAQSQARLQELEQVEKQVSQGTAQDLRTLAIELNRLGLPVDTQKTDELKSEILSRVTAAKEQLPAQTEGTRKNQRRVLLKNAIKWNIGALVSSLLFFYIWRGTRWAR